MVVLDMLQMWLATEAAFRSCPWSSDDEAFLALPFAPVFNAFEFAGDGDSVLE